MLGLLLTPDSDKIRNVYDSTFVTFTPVTDWDGEGQITYTIQDSSNPVNTVTGVMNIKVISYYYY